MCLCVPLRNHNLQISGPEIGIGRVGEVDFAPQPNVKGVIGMTMGMVSLLMVDETFLLVLINVLLSSAISKYVVLYRIEVLRPNLFVIDNPPLPSSDAFCSLSLF